MDNGQLKVDNDEMKVQNASASYQSSIVNSQLSTVSYQLDVPPGYKQTEVGVIPQDWEVRPLLSAVSVATGQVDPRSEPYKSMVLVAPDHIESGTGRLLEERTASDQGAISGKYLFTPGDVVYSKIRPYLRKAILANFRGLCSADMYPLTPARDVSSGFVLAVLLGHRFSQFAENVSVRSGIPKINRDELAEYTVALPPLPEQQTITAALSDVDALIVALDKLIAKKRAIKTAAMQQLLTGKQRLPGFRGEWEVKRLGDAAEVVMGQSPVGTSYNRSGIGAPLINGPTEFTEKHPIKIQWTSQPAKFCKTGDLLLCVRGSSTGRINISDDEYCIGRGVAAIRAKPGADTSFIIFQVDAAVKSILALTTGSTFPNIDGKSIRAIDLALPPIEEQTAIATILSDMDAEIAALEARRDKTQAIKQGMMQELLTGRIRLV